MDSQAKSPGPSELQKIYGSNLPPSLRWGAVRTLCATQSQEPASIGPPKARYKTPRAEAQAHPSSSPEDVQPHRATAPEVGIYRRPIVERVPYASRGTSRADRPVLQISDKPAYDQYGHESVSQKEDVDVHVQSISPKEARTRNQQRVKLVLEAFASPKRSQDDKTRNVARAFLDRTNVGKARKKRATGEENDTNKETPIQLGADVARDEVNREERNHPPRLSTPTPPPPTPPPPPPEFPAEGHKQDGTNPEHLKSRDIEAEIRALEVERRALQYEREAEEWHNRAARLRERPEQFHSDRERTEGSQNRGDEQRRPNRIHSEQIFQEEMRRRLRKLSYSEDVIDTMVDEQKLQQFIKSKAERNQSAAPMRAPVYPRVHKDYLEVETLQYYDVPWNYDPRDSDYIIIRRDMDKSQTDILFEHTSKLRAGKLSIAPPESSRKRVPVKSRYDSTRHRHGVITTADEKQAAGLQAVSINCQEAFNDRAKSPPLEKGYRAANSSSKFCSISASPRLLKRVAHATYGDTLRETRANPPRLMAVPKANASEEEPLFYLQHFHQDSMDFEKFKTEVLQIPELLRVGESIESHLTEAQRLYEKPSHDGQPKLHMDPFCHQTPANKRGPHILSACIPFLELREHSHQTEARLDLDLIQKLWRHPTRTNDSGVQDPTSSDTTHRMRTLFQSLNPRNNSRRDLKQVVCQMLDPKDRRYLYLSQVWFLVINEELLITCSLLAEDELFGDLLQIPTTMTPDGRTWLLEHADCSTYLDLAAQFSGISTNFADDFAILLGGAEVSPEEWPRTVERAKHSTLRLRLRDRRRGVDEHGEPRFPPQQETSISRSIYQRLAHMSVARRSRPSDDDGSEADLYDDDDSASAASGASHGTFDGSQATAGDDNDGTTSSNHDKDPHVVAAPHGPSTNSGSPEVDGESNRSAYVSQGSVMDEGAAIVHDELDIQLPSMAGLVEGSDDKSRENDSSSIAKDANKEQGATDKADDSTDANSTRSTKSAESNGMIRKPLGNADILRRLGLRFEETEDGFFVQDDLTVQQKRHAMVYCSMLRPEELRTMTHEALSATMSPGGQSSCFSEAPVSRANKLVTLSPQDAPDFSSTGLFDEQVLYDICPRTGAEGFLSMLSEWNRTSDVAEGLEDLNREPTISVNVQELDAFCEALGYEFEEDDELGKMAPMDGWLFADLLNGFRCLTKIFLPATEDDRLLEVQERFLTATVTLVRSLFQIMELRPKLFVFLLRVLGRSFRRLFNIAKELEVYSVTSLTFRTTREVSVEESYDTLKHIVIALLLAVEATWDLDEMTPSVEAEIRRRQTALVSTGTGTQQTSDYSHVKDCCDNMSSSISIDREKAEDYGERQKEKHRLQNKFREGVDRLEKMGWGRIAARHILANEYRWTRVRHHADSAWKMLHRGFRATLSADENKKIQWKAAAFPTDVMALVLPQVLWRPILGDRDAVDMYNQYITDLESNILTGDPSREPLDRIRNLRHELNAFAQVQRHQIDVLEKINSALLPKDISKNRKLDDPHPRRAVFEALPEGVRVQNGVIEQLSGMLDGLQHEARAQISSVQDWRDNATVVFTIITIIFLPLSFVSSVFGMNTSDVRDMTFNQWVFWAAALPFTLLVILVTIYFVDVPPLWRWLERRGDKSIESHRGFVRKDDASKSRRTGFLASVARKRREDAVGMHDGLGGWEEKAGEDDAASVSSVVDA